MPLQDIEIDGEVLLRIPVELPLGLEKISTSLPTNDVNIPMLRRPIKIIHGGGKFST